MRMGRREAAMGVGDAGSRRVLTLRDDEAEDEATLDSLIGTRRATAILEVGAGAVSLAGLAVFSTSSAVVVLGRDLAGEGRPSGSSSSSSSSRADARRLARGVCDAGVS